MKQSRLMSLVEAIGNVLVGVAVAFTTQVVVFPWFDIHVSTGEHAIITIIFTAVSLVRSYALRRAFEWVRTEQCQDYPTGYAQPIPSPAAPTLPTSLASKAPASQEISHSLREIRTGSLPVAPMAPPSPLQVSRFHLGGPPISAVPELWQKPEGVVSKGASYELALPPPSCTVGS